MKNNFPDGIHAFWNQIASVALVAALGCGVCSAATMHWTLEPDSSLAWPVDPYFGAVSGNPYDILKGISVDFIGWKHAGSSTETLNGGHLVYRWRLDFDEPVLIQSVTMAGLGDQTANSQMRLLDDHKNVIASQPLTGYNTLATNVLHADKHARGKTFYYDEFDVSWDARYRTTLKVSYREIARCGDEDEGSN
jgi:hypothetical protein